LRSLNYDCSGHERHGELKLVWLEPSGHEDSEYVRNNFWYIWEQNTSSKCLATLFSAARGPIRGRRDFGRHMATGSVKSSTSRILHKLYIPHSPPLAHTWRTWLKISQMNEFCKKTSNITKIDSMLEDKIFFQIYHTS
jgi:hypothetical protein